VSIVIYYSTTRKGPSQRYEPVYTRSLGAYKTMSSCLHTVAPRLGSLGHFYHLSNCPSSVTKMYYFVSSFMCLLWCCKFWNKYELY